MDKATLLYLLFIPNMILMFYTLMSIREKDGLTGARKNALIYTTLFFPVIGLACLYIPVERKRIRR